jgi:hypothetical protein
VVVLLNVSLLGFPLPPVSPPIGDTSLSNIVRLATHSTTSPTPTAMGQSFILLLYDLLALRAFYYYSFPPLPYLFYPSYLPSVFIQYFSPFLSLPLSHFAAFTPRVFDRLCFLAAHPTPSFFFFFCPIPILSFSLALSLPRYNGTSSAMHLSYSLLYVDSLILSLLSCLPYFCPSRSSPHTSALSLSTSSPSFLYSTQTVSCTLSFRPFCPRTLPLSFPLSFSVSSSCSLPSLFTLVFLCPLLAPISNISLALSPPPSVPSIPRSQLRTSARSLPCSRTSSFSSRTHLPTFCLLFPKRIQLPCSPSSLPLSLAPCPSLSH